MYNYTTEKPKLFTEEGQVMFLAIRDRANKLIDTAGAVSMDKAVSGQSGDSWQMLACMDRLVELREIVEVTQENACAGQDRIFTRR